MSSQLAAKFAQQVVHHNRAFDGKARKFFFESLHLEEIIPLQDLRTAVNNKFKLYGDVKNEKVVDMLIFKGREELEISEYIDPMVDKASHLPDKPTGLSPFLEAFLDKNVEALRK